MPKTLFATLLLVACLGGCTKLPGAPAPEAETVTSVHHNPVAKPVQTRIQPEGEGAIPGVYVDHSRSAATFVPVKAATSQGTAGASAKASDAAPETSSALPATSPASATSGAPALTISQAPAGSFRMFPIISSNDEVLAARFSPAIAKATWQVAVDHGSLSLAKVIVTVTDGSGQHAMAASTTAANLKWPANLSGSQALSLPLNSDLLLGFMQKNPAADRALLSVTLEDAAGKPIVDPDGAPVSLALALEIL